MVINYKKMWGPFTHHWHLEGIDIKRSDFPVTADIVDELDQTMKPKHSRNDQDENHENIFLDAKIEKKTQHFIFSKMQSRHSSAQILMCMTTKSVATFQQKEHDIVKK